MKDGVRIEPLDRDHLRAAIQAGGGGPVVPDHIRAAIHAGTIGQVIIYCDGCGVEEEGDYTGESREVRFAAARRWLAETKGWQITDGTDLCPDCQASLAEAAALPDPDEDDPISRFLTEGLGDVRFQFWICPIEGHSDRKGPNGELVETVRWDGDVARCTSPGCGRTSADREEDR